MPLIKWDESLSVEINEIDKQHQTLINLLNLLNDAMMTGKGKEILNKIIIELMNYTKIHFKTEEDYFDRYGYPETLSHKKEHSDFTGKVSEFRQRYEEGKLGLSTQIMTFLSDWLKNHIMGTDKKYTKFFKSKNLH